MCHITVVDCGVKKKPTCLQKLLCLLYVSSFETIVAAQHMNSHERIRRTEFVRALWRTLRPTETVPYTPCVTPPANEHCAICCAPMWPAPFTPSSVKLLACGHVFHEHCIARWFAPSAHRACPLCRHEAQKVTGTTPNLSLNDARRIVSRSSRRDATDSRTGAVAVRRPRKMF